MKKGILKEISKLRKKLDMTIKKKGIADEETANLSEEMNELVNEYEREYSRIRFDSDMEIFYKISYQALKEKTKLKNDFPSVIEWDKYAMENNYLSHVSLEYINKLNWKYLKIKVNREINLKI